MRKYSAIRMSAPRHLHAIVSMLLFVGPLFLGGAMRAEDSDDRVSVTNRRFTSLVLPRVSFRDADLIGALQYLKRKAAEESNGALTMPFVLELPRDFRPRYELSLDMRSIPYAKALHYLGELAGVRFSQENGAVFVRPDNSGPAPPPLAPEKERAASTPFPAKDLALTGKLGKPAEPTLAGKNTYRSTDGTLQVDKSGFIPRRELNGFPAALKNLDVDCARRGVCPSGACGCSVCTCRTR
jgi:hypothetical protein